jgi:hypothetical protein
MEGRWIFFDAFRQSSSSFGSVLLRGVVDFWGVPRVVRESGVVQSGGPADEVFP